MTTKCNTEQLAFQGLGRREVVGRFDGGEISSDGGGLLLREVEQRTQILRRLSQCFKPTWALIHDARSAGVRIEHAGASRGVVGETACAGDCAGLRGLE